MVWAVAFARGIFEGQTTHHAAVNARVVVERMRDIPADANIAKGETMAMLDEMRGCHHVASPPDSTSVPELKIKLLGKIQEELNNDGHFGTGHLTEYIGAYEMLCRAERAGA